MLKFGMTTPSVQSALTNTTGPLRIALAIAASPLVLIGLASFGLSAVLWLFVLSKVSLSSAYPFVALGIVITVAAGRLLLGEPIPAVKLVGVALIVSGVLAVGAAG
jgi:multidrug transporter EmrE-like cation transporter